MTEREIFIAALHQREPAARAAFLDRACGEDRDLRARVEELLREQEHLGSFLEEPAEQPGVPAAPDATKTGPAAEDDGAGLDFLAPPDRPDILGRLGHYEVLEVIGRGGMGVVLRAFDERLHRVVAIKVMAQQLATSATARRRFAREAQAQAAVSHDHVVAIHAVEEAGGLPYLVMQYVAGESVQEWLDRVGPLALPEVLRVGMQTAAGLAAAHAQGLIHRDVKPANLLLENGVQRVKITDFGLARAADDASLTQSGVVAGTPHYMSPEQARGEAVDPRSDLFSLGSVLYAMCTGGPPFRADGSMAVLRRVCDGAPTPVREANPEVPDWLAAIIEKLHAKDPAGRYQSAAEVAELLGQHLADVQHPSVVPAPAAGPPARPRRSTRRLWAVAAAALLLLAAGLGLAEATGATRMWATAIRLFTPEGTLVVETDDPAVKVTIEGDGDLVISGAGPQEVRLKSGSYKLRAARDGKAVKLDRDLVTITHGDTQVVRVRLEGEAPAAVPAKVEQGAFVLLGGDGVAERKFETLAEAVRVAGDGDTIDVRGNGPFLQGPISISGRAIRIRAGDGFRPVFHLSSRERPLGLGTIDSESGLVLEGLEFQQAKPGPSHPYASGLISVHHAPLYVANCRFVGLPGKDLIPLHAESSRRCEVCNCQLIGKLGFSSFYSSDNRTVLRNNLIVAKSWPVTVGFYPTASIDLQLTRNTFVGGAPLSLQFHDPNGFPDPVAGVPKWLRAEASGNIFDIRAAIRTDVLWMHSLSKKRVEKPAELWQQWTGWTGHHNLFSTLSARVITQYAPNDLDRFEISGLADWRRFWGDAEANSVEGRSPRYLGGDALDLASKAPEQLNPEDFRLHPHSAGHGAGPDGQDLGADVELVGPGEAYERWKKTPECQQWLIDTGQKK
jgi:hypothetical protein